MTPGTPAWFTTTRQLFAFLSRPPPPVRVITANYPAGHRKLATIMKPVAFVRFLMVTFRLVVSFRRI